MYVILYKPLQICQCLIYTKSLTLAALGTVRERWEKAFSSCCGFESVYIKADLGASMENLRVAVSYASSKGVDDVWYHAPLSTPLHFQQTLCTEQKL